MEENNLKAILLKGGEDYKWRLILTILNIMISSEGP